MTCIELKFGLERGLRVSTQDQVVLTETIGVFLTKRTNSLEPKMVFIVLAL